MIIESALQTVTTLGAYLPAGGGQTAKRCFRRFKRYLDAHIPEVWEPRRDAARSGPSPQGPAQALDEPAVLVHNPEQARPKSRETARLQMEAERLCDAVRSDTLEAVAELLDGKALDTPTQSGLLPLHQAILVPSSEQAQRQVKALLVAGARVNRPARIDASLPRELELFEQAQTHWSALACALAKGRLDVAELLATRGADLATGVDAFVVCSGWTQARAEQAVLFLLRNGLDRKELERALVVAVRNDDATLITCLIQRGRGASVETRDEGASLLHLAIDHRLPHATEALLDADADFSEVHSRPPQRPDQGCSPMLRALHEAALAMQELGSDAAGDEERATFLKRPTQVLRLLLRQEAAVNFGDRRVCAELNELVHHDASEMVAIVLTSATKKSNEDGALLNRHLEGWMKQVLENKRSDETGCLELVRAFLQRCETLPDDADYSFRQQRLQRMLKRVLPPAPKLSADAPLFSPRGSQP